MALTDLLRHVVTIRRRDPGVEFDDHGVRTGTFTTIPDVPAFVQPIRMDEVRAGGDYAIGDHRMLLAPASAIYHGDRVTWENRSFDVIEIMRHTGPGVHHHTTVRLREVATD